MKLYDFLTLDTFRTNKSSDLIDTEKYDCTMVSLFGIGLNQYQIAQLNYTKKWTQTPILFLFVPLSLLQLNAFSLVEGFI